MKNTFLLTICIFLLLSSHAQTKEFTAAYYIDLNGDTLYGFIRDLKENQLSHSFIFKKSITQTQVSEIDAKACKSFFVQPDRKFVSINDTIFKTQVFAKELATGPLSLYCYYDSDPLIFYFKKEGEAQFTRMQKMDQAGVNNQGLDYMREDTKYIGLLNLLMQDCEGLSKKINQVSYNANSFVKLVDQYNSCINPHIEYASKTRKTKFRFGPEIGTLVFLNQQLYSTKYDTYEPTAKPGLTVGAAADIQLAKRLFLDFGLLYTQYQFNIEWNGVANPYLHENVDFYFKYLDFPVTIKLKILTTKISPFVYGGGIYGLLLSHKYVVESDHPQLAGTYELNLDNSKFGYIIGAGVSYNDKAVLKIGYFGNTVFFGANTAMTNSGVEIKFSWLF